MHAAPDRRLSALPWSPVVLVTSLLGLLAACGEGNPELVLPDVPPGPTQPPPVDEDGLLSPEVRGAVYHAVADFVDDLPNEDYDGESQAIAEYLASFETVAEAGVGETPGTVWGMFTDSTLVFVIDVGIVPDEAEMPPAAESLAPQGHSGFSPGARASAGTILPASTPAPRPSVRSTQARYTMPSWQPDTVWIRSTEVTINPGDRSAEVELALFGCGTISGQVQWPSECVGIDHDWPIYPWPDVLLAPLTMELDPDFGFRAGVRRSPDASLRWGRIGAHDPPIPGVTVASLPGAFSPGSTCSTPTAPRAFSTTVSL